MNSENLNASDSLKIISEMIEQAKGNVKRDSFYFLLWGWVIVIANLSIYFLLKFTAVTNPYWVWLITLPTWGITILHGYKQNKSATTRSHFDTVRMWLWFAFGITTCLCIFFGAKINYQLNGVILLIAAIPTFISGALIKFKPLLFGGIMFWIFGSLCFVTTQQNQLLLASAGIFLGYLIPGYLLKKSHAVNV